MFKMLLNVFFYQFYKKDIYITKTNKLLKISKIHLEIITRRKRFKNLKNKKFKRSIAKTRLTQVGGRFFPL